MELGAYNPAASFAGPPMDLDDHNTPIHPLLARAKWTQVPDSAIERWAGFWDVRYGAMVDRTGQEGRYDVHANPKVWAALEPALRLVSKVLASDHPFWTALTNIHSHRPVDAVKDGRTENQRNKEGGVPYTSVWMDTGDGRAPDPYPEMPNLEARGFDAQTSRAQCLRILDANLTWSIFLDGTIAGRTRWSAGGPDDAFAFRICISASLLYPLLLPTLSQSERVTVSIILCPFLDVPAFRSLHARLIHRPK